jgi:hypothetical protein
MLFLLGFACGMVTLAAMIAGWLWLISGQVRNRGDYHTP